MCEVKNAFGSSVYSAKYNILVLFFWMLKPSTEDQSGNAKDHLFQGEVWSISEQFSTIKTSVRQNVRPILS
jgi:hypothetical protein